MNLKGTIVLTRHLALVLAKIAPVVGVFVFISAIQATGSEVGLWTRALAHRHEHRARHLRHFGGDDLPESK